MAVKTTCPARLEPGEREIMNRNKVLGVSSKYEFGR